MRIAVCVPVLNEADAVGNYTRQVCETLSKFGEVDLLTDLGKVNWRRETKSKITYIDAPKPILIFKDFIRFKLTGFFVYKLKNQLRNYDLVWLIYSTFTPFIYTFSEISSKKIFDYQGITPLKFVSNQEKRTVKETIRGTNAGVKFSDICIVHSKFTENELEKYSGIKPKNIEILPYSLPGDFKKVPQREITKINKKLKSKNEKILLYVGRIHRNKKIEVIVKALKIINQKIPEAKLVLIGNDKIPQYYEYKLELLKLGEKLGIDKKILFLGQIPGNLYPYYKISDIFVCASEHEGFCIPLIEAMYCGLPCVASKSSAIPETLGGSGLLFEPGDHFDLSQKIMKFLESDSLKKELVKKGYVRFEEFTPKNLEKKIEKIFKEIIIGR